MNKLTSEDCNEIVQLEKLLLKEPNNQNLCQKLAMLYKGSHDWQSISTLFVKNVKQKTIIANCFFNGAYYAKQRNEIDLAILLYSFSLELHVQSPEEVYLNLSVIYSEELRAEDKAIEMLQCAISANADFTPALYNLAGLYEEIGSKALAYQNYYHILKLEPENVAVLLRLAACTNDNQTKQFLINQLLSILDKTISNYDQITDVYYALGKLYDEDQNYSLAFAAYEKANELNAKDQIKYSTTLLYENFQNIKRLFTTEWFANLPVISNAKHIFICGMYRSGSTLLEQILSSHEKIHSGGEINFFDKVWNVHGSGFLSGIANWSVSDWRDLANNYENKLQALFPGQENVIDKMPHNFIYIGLIKSLFPQAIIINTVRDPIDNYLSIYFQRFSNDLNYTTSLTDIHHYFKQYKSLMEYWKSLFPNEIFSVQYEHLVKDPIQATKGVFQALGLNWQAQCLQFHSNNNYVKTASIWQVRKPLYDSSCGRSANYSTAINMSDFDA